ncbi:MAG: exodeoxyribonuclease VII small subunit [Candidatus Promineifilaceae bacterium]|nr:exodeoxyribonuclease VII small subunit [Candidatus Promineifilaceae bacterium]
MAKDDVEALTFEEALAELETIVERLDAGELVLEEALALFERGQALADHCNEQLEAATLRVEQLTEDGEIVEINVEEEA